MVIIDFTGLKLRNKAYAGKTGSKISVEYQGELYMLKFPAYPKKNKDMSYSNSCFSEYLGCHVYELIGIPVQKTLLGTYTYHGKTKVVVACKDFTAPGVVLQNIRSTTRKSRKNNPSLHTWSFYRLSQYIEYKAKLAGIIVEYVNPAYTSKRCPVCGEIHDAEDRNYQCTCGYHAHRDLVGAINICNSTEYVGKRHTA